MKDNEKIIKELSTKSPRQRLGVIQRLLTYAKPPLVVALLLTLRKLQVPNGRRQVVNFMANSKNPFYLDSLVQELKFTQYDYVERDIVLAALIKIGAFDRFFGHRRPGINIQKKLFLINKLKGPKTLIQILENETIDFEELVKSVESDTSHWTK
ncbi:hypothetical protein [Dyadobacter aurulentus]|uniref:hypothetical protein n=1 Tax=Dyadobacter sp. UC 10 TaxID=2605428 RepID=UPI0011F284DB|nr:hypothetical protein [Dyadobacter sp. UC 10]KAA0991274.1 hypothetical protein FXO21_14440 [Dyadobacter sp. UC 10]